ncbi:TIR domain-containing protein [Pseudomonas yamanorum]|uniref:TIR domain-containing protein n=1 Tax=Pseudomonas yamanorum TaxID=515393 RepID=UPI001C4309C1|nr:TIR domain-containing protein [Pseudomonas yamanorum]
MPRKTFFSYHYEAGVWRAWNVRNSWIVRDKEEISAGFFDNSVFEASKKESDDALKKRLRNGLDNTFVTCALAGTHTWNRRWDRHEIASSIIKGNSLPTVYIHDVQNSAKQPSAKVVALSPTILLQFQRKICDFQPQSARASFSSKNTI